MTDLAAKRSTGSQSRRVALEALVRIDTKGAYANLVLPKILERSNLNQSDRHLVTSLVYGTTRMRRALDHLVDRFLRGDVEPVVRAALRLGSYQLKFLGTPPHAALDATVGAVPGRGRSVVNAVLRRVVDAPVEYPSVAVELSYPDWIVDTLVSDLGHDRAIAALRAMNQPAEVVVRDDGYVQDRASQLVVEAVAAGPSELVIDLCAAPGGKTTALAATGALVIGSDASRKRAGLIWSNAEKLGQTPRVLVADGTSASIRPGSADRVLVDAPCSGLGSLRRRADARWRIDSQAPARLGRLQADLVLSGLELLKPGGQLTYSVCTLTEVESGGVLDQVMGAATQPIETITTNPGPHWKRDGGVFRLEPGETDAMAMFQLRRL